MAQRTYNRGMIDMDNIERSDITTLLGATIKSIEMVGLYVVITFTDGRAIQCEQAHIYDQDGNYHDISGL